MEKMHRLVVAILEMCVSVLFISITGITLAEVVCRYVLGFSLVWSHEVVVLLFIWTVWICIPIGLARNSHMAMTILRDRISESSRQWLSRVGFVLALAFFGLLFFLTFPVLESFDGMFLTTIPFSINTHYYAMVVGSILSLFVLITGNRQGKSGG